MSYLFYFSCGFLYPDYSGNYPFDKQKKDDYCLNKDKRDIYHNKFQSFSMYWF